MGPHKKNFECLMKISNFNNNNYCYFVKASLHLPKIFTNLLKLAHGMLNNEGPIIVFQIEKLKRNDHNYINLKLDWHGLDA